MVRPLRHAAPTALALALWALPAMTASADGGTPSEGTYPTAAASLAEMEEALDYRWNLGGFFGTIARVLLPGQGSGRLSATPVEGGLLELELLITSEQTERGEFWVYRSRIDPRTGRTLFAESEYDYRGKSKHRESDLEDEEVIDIASGIHLIRRRRPQEPLDLRIWSDGKIYPVAVESRGWVEREIEEGETRAEWFAIRPREVPGQREWEGRMDLYLADDERATPVEISVDRSLARVRLRLTEPVD